MHSHATSAVTDDVTSQRALKAPRLDTVNAVLARPAGDIPCPPKSFRFPLCQEHIGRKGLAGHLRKDYQIDKPPFFDFQPNRDMHPGRLACLHCSSSFTTEAAIRLHYQRATCPALFVEWVQDQHFGTGSTPLNSNPQPDQSVTNEQMPPCEPDLQWRPPLIQPRTGDPLGLCIPLEAPAWHPTMVANMFFYQSTTLSLSDTPVFWPELRLRWYTTFNWPLAHIHHLPQIILPNTPHFRLLIACATVHPIYWAWTSD